MIQAFSAVSTQTDSFEAGRQAAGEAVSKLSAKPDMIWAFGAISYDQQRLLDGIAAASPGTPIIGCSTDGEISSSGLTVNSVVALALSSDRVRFRTAYAEHLSKDSYSAGAELAEKFQDLGCSYLQIFSDGLSGNADQIIQRRRRAGRKVPRLGL